MIETTVIGKYIGFWFPNVPNWASSLVLFIFITGVNLIQVEVYGELEFWFSLSKVVTIIFFILAGIYLIVTNTAGGDSSVSNLWTFGGFMPNGIKGLLASLGVVIFAYGGTELIGVTAGEAKDPLKSIPKAINQVMWRIMLFYIAALTIVMIVTPWNTIDGSASPFAQVFMHAGISSAANIINLICITAILSAYNSGLYSNARMLYSL